MKKLLIIYSLILLFSSISYGQSCSTVTLCTSGNIKLSGNGSLTIKVNVPAPNITSGNPPNGQAGVVFPAFSVTGSGGTLPYIFGCNGCGAAGLNLSINSGTGAVTGTPTVANTYTGTFTLQDANGINAPPFAWSIVISAGTPALTITSAVLPSGQVGFNYLCNGGACTATASGGTPPYAWSLFQPTKPLGYEDMLDWVLPDSTTRAANYFVGNAERKYSFLDGNSTPGTFWWVKDVTGHPWDIQLYDNYYLYLWITENGDQGAFTNPQAYKRFTISRNNPTDQGLIFAPRYFNPGSVITYLSPGPNYIKRTLNCEADNQALINIGDVKTTTTGPTNVAWGGSIGTQPTIVVSYYYSGNAGVYGDLEQYSLVKNFGQVQWQHFTWNGSMYVLQQTSTFINKVAGSTSIVFPCAVGASWYPAKDNTKLPPGLTLNSSTGTTTGTPTTQGTYLPTLQVTDNVSATSTQAENIVITAPCSVSISPLSQNVVVSNTLQFTITTNNCSPGTTTNYVNNVAGGNATVGTITSSGLYTAPANVPNPATVTIKAVSDADNTKTALASVTILANQAGCGPPAYNCSNSTANIAQVSQLFTSANAKNTIKFDTTLNPSSFNPIVRCTDPTSNVHSLIVTPSQADGDNIFNTDDTVLVVTDYNTNSNYLVPFNISTMQCGTLSAAINGTAGFTFARTNRLIAYGIKYTGPSGVPELHKFTLNGVTGTITWTDTTLLTFNSSSSPCFDMRGAALTSSSAIGPLGISADDSVIGGDVLPGVQDSGGWVFTYYLSGANAGKCTTYRPDTGIIKDINGNQLTSTTACRYPIHANRLFEDGLYQNIANGCTQNGQNCPDGCPKVKYYWQVNTGNVFPFPNYNQNQGHDSHGYATSVIGNNPNFLKNDASTNFQTITQFGAFPAGLLEDIHMSWNNANTTDSNPVIGGTQCDAVGNCDAVNFKFPYVNEIISLFPNNTFANGRFAVRFAHNGITSQGNPNGCPAPLNFDVINGIGSVSQTGKLFAFTSDWLCGLGTDSLSQQRTDVFIVGLDMQFGSGTAPSVLSVAPNNGPTTGGTSVTITGTGFVAPATVQFGTGFATSVNVVNATTITCVTPSGSAGTTSVTVTNTGTGLSGTLNNAFTYNNVGGQLTLYPNGTITIPFGTVLPVSGWVNGGMGSQAMTWLVTAGAGSIDNNGVFSAPLVSGSPATVQGTSVSTGDTATLTINFSGSVPGNTCANFSVGDHTCTVSHDGFNRNVYYHVPTNFSLGNSGLIVALAGNDVFGANYCQGTAGSSGQETRYWQQYLDGKASPAPIVVCPDAMYYQNSQHTVCNPKWNALDGVQSNFYPPSNPTCSGAGINVDDVGFIQSVIDIFTKNAGVNAKKVWLDSNWNNGTGMALRFVLAHPELIAAWNAWELQPALRQVGCTTFPTPPTIPVAMLNVIGSGSSDPYKICGSNIPTCANTNPGDINPISSIDSEMNYWLPNIGNPGTVGASFCTGGDGSSYTGTQERHSNVGTLGMQIQQYALVGGINQLYCSVVGGCPGNVQGPYVNFSTCNGTSGCPKNTTLNGTTGVDMDTIIYNFFVNHPKP